MKKMKFLILPLCLMLLAAPAHASAVSEAELPEGYAEEAAALSEAGEGDNLVVTKHSAVVNGKELHYTVTAGTMTVSAESTNLTEEYSGENPEIEMFFTAYTLDDADPAERPVTFAFNGGPGSSSVWIHLGFLGPRRIKMDENGFVDSLTPGMEDNENSFLDMTDLVFIDPVYTGYSRPVKGNSAEEYLSYEGDCQVVGDFIHTYISRFGRWGSPRYLCGESYGTVRAVGVCDYLAGTYFLKLNGLLLISTCNDYSALTEAPGNDLPYIMNLPTYAADAWYHGLLDETYQNMELEEFLEEVRAFAGGEYQSALFKGNTLTDEETDAIAEKLSSYTGLKKEYLKRADLRVFTESFCKELLRDRGEIIGRVDGRFTGYEGRGNDSTTANDPSLYGLDGAYASVINDYLSRELGFRSDLNYMMLKDFESQWTLTKEDDTVLKQQDIIESVMSQNSHLKIWVLCGYYDLATPFYAAEWTYNHVNLSEKCRDNLMFTYYPSGHMIYLHKPSLEKVHEQALEWYAK